MLLFLQVCLLIFMHVLRADDSDFQIWIKHHLITKLSDDWHLRWRGETRWERNAGRLFQIYQQAGLQKNITNRWGITGWYRQELRRNENEVFKKLSIVITDLDGRLGDGVFSIDRRSRLQFVLTTEDWFFRDRTRLWLPWRFYRDTFRLFVSNEFYLKRFQEFVDNRFIVGVSTRLPGQASVRTGYMLRCSKVQNAWQTDNVLVFRTFLTF